MIVFLQTTVKTDFVGRLMAYRQIPVSRNCHAFLLPSAKFNIVRTCVTVYHFGNYACKDALLHFRIVKLSSRKTNLIRRAVGWEVR